MYFQYGNYRHASGEGLLRVLPPQTTFTQAGLVESVTHRWAFEGRLQANTPAELTTAIQAMRAAYDVQGLSCGLFEDDGTPTAHIFNNLGGVIHVVSGPSFPATTPGDYTTFVDYTIEIEARVTPETDGGGDGSRLDFQEQLSFSGGGPIYVYRVARNGAPQRQLVTEQDTFKATQEGECTCRGMWPLPPQPKWPESLLQQQSTIVMHPAMRSGAVGQEIIWTCKTSWRYVFESASPMYGLPSTIG